MRSHLHLAESDVDHRQAGPTSGPIRVVLADDHLLMRRSLRFLLDAQDDVAVIAEAADCPTVVEHVIRHHPAVLVADLRLAHGSDIESIRRLREQAPETEVVVLTMSESPLLAHRAFDAGAIGFVVKERADTELPAAIRRAARGEQFVSDRVAAGLEGFSRGVEADGLVPREVEILRLIAFGYTSAEIGKQLHLSRRTIETARTRIYERLDLQTRAELVRYALRHHLIGS